MNQYEEAQIMGKRTFVENSTETIRTCPENYCLAHRKNGRWQAYRDEGITRHLHDRIQETLDTWQGGSTSAALAKELAKLLPATPEELAKAYQSGWDHGFKAASLAITIPTKQEAA